MPAKRDPLPTYPCSNPQCGEQVKPRRRSTSGDHWCSSRDCQAMKQRQLRAARKTRELKGSSVEDERIVLVHRALHEPRQACPKCGLGDGVPGFAHRASAGGTACDGLGSGGRAAGARWLDLIHPERAPA